MMIARKFGNRQEPRFQSVVFRLGFSGKLVPAVRLLLWSWSLKRKTEPRKLTRTAVLVPSVRSLILSISKGVPPSLHPLLLLVAPFLFHFLTQNQKKYLGITCKHCSALVSRPRKLTVVTVILVVLRFSYVMSVLPLPNLRTFAVVNSNKRIDRDLRSRR